MPFFPSAVFWDLRFSLDIVNVMVYFVSVCFSSLLNEVGVCLLGCTACHVRLVGHFDFHSASIVYHAVGYVVFVIILAIDSDAVNIYVAAAVFRSVNNELSAVFQVERDFS